MATENTSGSVDSHSQQDIFPPFPAPRVWHFGGEGQAWSGSVHDESTADFMPDQNPIDITIISQRKFR